MNSYNFKTNGTCSQMVHFDLDENNQIHNVSFQGGCNGNLKAIGILVEGKDAREISGLLRGNDCNGRGTSCADQLAQAIEQALAQ